MLSPITTESPAAGAAAVEAAPAALATRLPTELQPLAELAYNYRWSWTTGGPEPFAGIDPIPWGLCPGTPRGLLEEVPPAVCARLSSDADFAARMHEVHARV